MFKPRTTYKIHAQLYLNNTCFLWNTAHKSYGRLSAWTGHSVQLLLASGFKVLHNNKSSKAVRRELAGLTDELCGRLLYEVLAQPDEHLCRLCCGTFGVTERDKHIHMKCSFTQKKIQILMLQYTLNKVLLRVKIHILC